MGEKFTPGPWEVVESICEVTINEPDGSVIAYAAYRIETADKKIHEGEAPHVIGYVADFESMVYPHLGTAEGNARLWAAAPDLLAACKNFLYGRKDNRECEAEMRAAIANAERGA